MTYSLHFTCFPFSI